MLYTIFIGIDSCQYRIFKTYRVIFHFPALIIKIFILLKQCLFVFCSMSYFLLSKKEEESRERVSWTRILLLWVLFFFLFFYFNFYFIFIPFLSFIKIQLLVRSTHFRIQLIYILLPNFGLE